MLSIWAYDETYIQLSFDDQWVLEEIADYFTFEIPNAHLNPLVKYGKWDGKLRIFKRKNNTIYKGLLSHVIEFCKDRKIKATIEPSLLESLKENMDFNATSFISTLGIKNIEPYDYQIDTIQSCIRAKRKLLISPTSSGKSFLMYGVLRWLENQLSNKILVIVPTVDLVLQLTDEWKNYSDYPIADNIHQIFEGQPKNSKQKIYVSTWQSLQNEKPEYFKQFGAIICDEAHTMSADTIKGIFESSVDCEYRYGFTGTIKDTETHKLVLEGLTGKLLQVTTTKELMDKGIVSSLSINCMLMRYDEETAKKVSKMPWPKEQSFIVNHAPRNKLIVDLALKIKDQNVLILTQYIEHIEILKHLLEKCGKTVFVITGKVKKESRLEKRIAAEIDNNIIFLCTFGTFSTGINVKNLQHLIFATAGKSSIKILQSIGRILRLDGKLNKATLWDLVDDAKSGKKKNISLEHFFERIKIYLSQKFDFKIVKVKI